jgi:hypothetical protein
MALLQEVAERPHHAAWTLPPQPLPRRAALGRRVGGAVAAIGLAAAVAAVAVRLLERRRAPAPAASAQDLAARDLGGAAAILALSVLSDSAVEHYRGAYHNPAMYVAPTVAAVSLGNSLHIVFAPQDAGIGRLVLSGLTLGTGAAGLAFHLYNIAKREGGVRLQTLFYGAPLGAPAAIALCGLCGLAAARLVAEAEAGAEPILLGRPAGAVIAGGSALAMLGTVGEVWLLHFRGAYHNPFMFVPVALPPAAATVLMAAARWKWLYPTARILLRLTAAMGIAGAGFHVYGVSRNMGGFYNWSQNILNGPPIPAPPSFTGVALTGLAAVRLMEAA